MMFQSILLSALISVVIADSMQKTFEENEKFQQECLKSENISGTNVKKIRKGIYENDEEVYNYVRCIGLKTETWTDDDGYSGERILQLSGVAGINAIGSLEECLHPERGNAAKRAYVGFKCILRHIKNVM